MCVRCRLGFSRSSEGWTVAAQGDRERAGIGSDPSRCRFALFPATSSWRSASGRDCRTKDLITRDTHLWLGRFESTGPLSRVGATAEL